MSTLKVLVVGDELDVGGQISSLIEEVTNYHHISTTISEPEALNQYLNEKPDLILMDEKHQDKIFGKTRTSEVNIPILLFKQQEEGTDIKPTRLIQPIKSNYKDFLTTYAIQVENLAKHQFRTSHPYFRDRFYIKNKSKLDRVEISDILWIQSDKKYCTIVTKKRKFVIRIALKNVADKLDTTKFARIHRSYIVQIAYIESINLTLGEAYVQTHRVPIGKKYQDTLFQQLNLL